MSCFPSSSIQFCLVTLHQGGIIVLRKRLSLEGGIARLTQRDPGDDMHPLHRPAGIAVNDHVRDRLKSSIPQTISFPDCLPGYDYERFVRIWQERVNDRSGIHDTTAERLSFCKVASANQVFYVNQNDPIHRHRQPGPEICARHLYKVHLFKGSVDFRVVSSQFGKKNQSNQARDKNQQR